MCVIQSIENLEALGPPIALGLWDGGIASTLEALTLDRKSFTLVGTTTPVVTPWESYFRAESSLLEARKLGVLLVLIIVNKY